MSAIRKLNNINETYALIQEYNEIKQRIAALEREKKILYTNITEGYFKEKEGVFTYNGMEKAVYKLCDRTDFNKSEFEISHPKLYEKFLVTTSHFRLTTK